MASLLENLIEVLDGETAEYEKLVTLAEGKTPVIVAGDVENLGKIMEEEQEIVGKIQGMEKKRNKFLADIANVVNRDVETLKLIDLIQMLESMPDQKQKLADVQQHLRATIDKLRELNAKNQQLLTERLEMVDFNLNMIRAMKSAPQTANYSKDAYTNGQPLGILHGGFDAKQ
ncbi:MAG: flagellar protein FlgN, partial [Lachnospiraceae bacterium]|nr:flagellar protein FlgN [Lachnospiraceae bacterium]MDE6983758.1 flagellar protein FlgN [Lachnospiraceae bacterium]MDE7029306.1 flagellar protein FlgN [Lachnospiraceae bacterium]